MHDDNTGNSITRRTALKGIAAAGAGLMAGGALARANGTSTQELSWMPAWRIQALIARGELSALEVTEHFIARIETLQPTLYMFRHFDPEGARAQAREADRRMVAGQAAGPLQGVPIGLKEHIEIKGLPTLTMPSGNAREATFTTATRDAIVVERLRAAGAIIMGSTLMPGMGIGPGMQSLDAHPRNPWDTQRPPGSSSAGSAAAVAAGALPVAIGSDGGGSTRLPAALSGIIGVHPTIGRLPDINYREPHLNMTTTLGPLTRDVRDAALVMQATAGPDGRDMLSTVHGAAPDYLALLERGASGLRVAWTDDYGFASAYAVEQTPRVIAAVRDSAQRIPSLGATLETTQERWESFWPYMALTQFLYDPRQPAHPGVREKLDEILAVRQRNRARFDALFRRHDVLASPTCQFTAPTLEDWSASWQDVQAFSPKWIADTMMFNWLGLPALSIPCGFVDGLPVGLQLVGPPDSEPTLLQLAHAYLQQFPWQARPPKA